MNPQRWQIIKEILADARERPPEGLQDWLQQACNGDRGLLEQVAGFLTLKDRLPGFLEAPILPLTDPESFAERAEEPGETDGNVGRKVGPYRLLRLIAQGGMGAVYVADREEEFEQRVALKLVRRRQARSDLVHRFHHERRILARLEHPNIARLLDGGTTEDGDPYFAMEWIQGVPLDRYCSEGKLSVRQRLELFLPVCSALALAHQNLVVHRDLKPANILVDRTGTPKLLDFGIAKLLDAEGPGAGVDLRNSALTPRYASPEQLRGEAVSTASDVYSLGVVLHQILTGSLPPPAATFPAYSPTVALGRLPNLDRDLNAIVARTLQPDPSRRYSSVEHLARDLRCYLQNFPVEARQGGRLYRAGKFLRRHRLGAVNGALMLTLALVFTFALVSQLRETERSRDSAQEIASFLVDLFLEAAPDRPAGDEPTVRDLLDAGRKKLAGALEQEPEVRGTLLLRLGEIYSKLGDYGEARALLEEALELLRRQHEGPHRDLATALSDLATVHYNTGDLEEAETLYRESVAMRRRLGKDENLIKPMNGLANILLERGKVREAEEIYRQGAEIRRGLLTANPDDSGAKANYATSLRSLAEALIQAGNLDAAEPLLRESLELRREVYGLDSTTVAMAEISLGRLERARGRLDEAEAWLTQGLKTRLQKLGPEHPYTALAQRDLAALRLEQGRNSEARELLHQALETLTPVRPEDAPDIVEIKRLLSTTPAAE